MLVRSDAGEAAAIERGGDRLASGARGIAVSPDLPANTSGWPTDPQRLVAHLNRWDRNQLELVARPELHPHEVDSGETSGWVEAHKSRLRAMGVDVVWNAASRCFAIPSR